MMGRFARHCAGVLLAMAVLLSPRAASAQDFYAGKRFTILVNFDAGGPNDIEARLIARHIGRHIPGNPTIIVQNMGGAGGMVGARWLGEVAPRDGSVAGYLTSAPQRYALAPERYTVDLRTYEYVAYMANGRIHFVRTDVKPGIKTSADILKADGVVAGGLVAEAPKDMAMRLVLDMLGIRYKYVTGYNATSRAMLAFQRNEINLFSDSPSAYVSNVDALVKAGQAIPVCYDPINRDGTYIVPKQMRSMAIISCPDLLKATKGGMPPGDVADAYQSLLSFAGMMYRTFVMPPGTPKVAVDIMRKAMVALNDDKEFQDEAIRTIAEAPDFISGPDINAEAARLMTISQKLKTFLADYVKKADQH